MADIYFDKPVGTSGKMQIRDTGYNVEYWIMCSDPATNVGSYSWSGSINGAGVGGSTPLPAGFGERLLGRWPVTTSQHVTFHQNPTGTQGLGGAADHGADIARGSEPVFSPPAQPAPVTLDQITPTSMRVVYLDGPDGGTPITSRALQVSQTPAFTGPVDTIGVDQSGIYVAANLLPAYPFYWRYRTQNIVGVSPWSYPVGATTQGFVWISDGTTYTRYAVDISDGVQWVRQIAAVSDGAAWLAGGDY